MEQKKLKDGWNPYLAGALTGLLAIASVWATTRWLGKPYYLGASTTFVRAAGYLEHVVAPERVESGEYYQRTKPVVDWQFMVVSGIFFGALLSSLTDKSFKLESVPPTWNDYFGPSPVKRAVAALLGGVVAMVGARMADGCPSGHGLSGVMQLSVSGLVAMAMFFAPAILAAHFIYKRRLL
jgi:uncharacterized membrane protein YedE/YeeE